MLHVIVAFIDAARRPCCRLCCTSSLLPAVPHVIVAFIDVACSSSSMRIVVAVFPAVLARNTAKTPSEHHRDGHLDNTVSSLYPTSGPVFGRNKTPLGHQGLLHRESLFLRDTHFFPSPFFTLRKNKAGGIREQDREKCLAAGTREGHLFLLLQRKVAFLQA